MTDESNGESTFEFVEKRSDESLLSGDSAKSDLLSSQSSSVSLMTPLDISTSIGNLLGNVAPPSELPAFALRSGSLATEKIVQNLDAPPQTKKYDTSKEPIVNPSPTLTKETGDESTRIVPTNPVPVIRPNASIQVSDTRENQAQESGMVGLFSWVKDTVVNSSVLSKVAERAKSSVNTMITTLDPQMREFIYSGGDIELVVASDKDVKVSPVRQAFQTVFGKATVTGVAVEVTCIAAQPVGFAAGVKGAEERINAARNNTSLPKDIPIIAVENFLLEVGEDKWYDLGVIVLNDPKRNVNLQTFTQMTPVPSQIVALAQQDTPDDYPLKWSGLAVTVGSLMATKLQVSHNEWHHELTGVSRRDLILLAVQSLAGIYKNAINPL